MMGWGNTHVLLEEERLSIQMDFPTQVHPPNVPILT